MARRRPDTVQPALEVTTRSASGSEPYTVGIRYLGDDVVEGGNRLEDAVWFGVRFAAAGADYLSISKGGRFEDARQPKVGEAVYPYTGRSGYECMPTVISDARGPFGRNVPLAAAIRAAVRAAGHDTPIVTSGGIFSFDQAEGILQRGEADFVAAARQSLADPDWFRKIRLGHGDLVRRCEFTNYCEGLDQHHKQVTCKLWDRVALDDPDVRLATDGKRRLSPPRAAPRRPRGMPARTRRRGLRRPLPVHDASCVARLGGVAWPDFGALPRARLSRPRSRALAGGPAAAGRSDISTALGAVG